MDNNSLIHLIMKLNMKLYTTDGAMSGEYSYPLLCKLRAKGEAKQCSPATAEAQRLF